MERRIGCHQLQCESGRCCEWAVQCGGFTGGDEFHRYDGISNLLERATAMNPNASDPVPVSVTKTATTLDFIYTKNKSATDLTDTVEWSDTLGDGWSTAGVGAPSIQGDNGVTQQIKVTVFTGVGVTQRFVYLKVTRP